MAQVLQQESCGFALFCPPLLNEQATTSSVRDAVLDLADELQEEDFALFFFSGHTQALTTEADLDDVYLVTHDFNASRVKRDRNAYLSLRWLRQVLFEHETAKHVLLILECCYAGKFRESAADLSIDELHQRLSYYFAEPGVQRSVRPAGVRLALTATGDACAREQGGHGLLTHALLAALRADAEQAVDEQGEVTFTGLFGFLERTMPQEQRPRFFGAGAGLVLARYPEIALRRRREREQERQWAVREQWLRSLVSDHYGFLQDRLASFVGRAAELDDIRQQILHLQSTGGYLAVTGQAGQGKSSLIARLVEAAAQGQGGYEHVAFHFIPLTPPPDYQVALLRNLMTRLVLKYHLSELYLASEHRAALCEVFPRVLKEIEEKGGREVIFIDGLDQLQADQQTGVRDLSFLPQGPGNPPQGIAFVLGTWPDDTLHPLELLKPYVEYRLPDLGRADFGRLLDHRGVTLELSVANRFYETLGKNALYLDLVAKEFAARRAMTDLEVAEVVRQITDDPENLFSLTIDRLRLHADLWKAISKPLPGFLLVAKEPLSRNQLMQLLNLTAETKVDGEQVGQGLERLGGLLVVDDQERYSLFHLKFRDYLLREGKRAQNSRIFDREDEQNLHACFVSWCERGGLQRIWQDISSDPVEQSRRKYARQHVIVHLYAARLWEKLFQVLDAGVYGRAKVQEDPGMRSYALDLDLGRQAAAALDWQEDETCEHLPALWRYTLLRCSLASRADNYPASAFQLMLALGQEAKASGLAELLTVVSYKLQIFTLLGCHLIKQPGREREALHMFLRVEQAALALTDGREQAIAMVNLAQALMQADQWQEAERVLLSIPATYGGYAAPARIQLGLTLARMARWREAERVVLSLFEAEHKAAALMELGMALHQAGRRQDARWNWIRAEGVILAIPSGEHRAEALARLSATLARVGHWQAAGRIAYALPDGSMDNKAAALAELAVALACAGQWRQWRSVILSITDARKRDLSLAMLGVALVRAGHW